eukprot:3495033-Pleurochrysis_carterae.AAC.2
MDTESENARPCPHKSGHRQPDRGNRARRAKSSQALIQSTNPSELNERQRTAIAIQNKLWVEASAFQASVGALHKHVDSATVLHIFAHTYALSREGTIAYVAACVRPCVYFCVYVVIITFRAIVHASALAQPPMPGSGERTYK